MAVISADDLRPDIDMVDIRWDMEIDKILEKIENYPSFTGTEFSQLMKPLMTTHTLLHSVSFWAMALTQILQTFWHLVLINSI